MYIPVTRPGSFDRHLVASCNYSRSIEFLAFSMAASVSSFLELLLSKAEKRQMKLAWMMGSGLRTFESRCACVCPLRGDLFKLINIEG